jgi:hypothetical protein
MTIETQEAMIHGQDARATSAHREGDNAMVDLSASERNDLKYWYPIAQAVVPTPQTTIVTTEIDLEELLDGRPVAGLVEFLGELKAAAQAMGLPCFLRTGQTSAKHSWRDSCFVADAECIVTHVRALVEYSALADLMGLDVSTWAVRELLPTRPVMVAFWGEMPIVRELRLFVRDGEIVHEQPYWPLGALRGHVRDEAELAAKIGGLQNFTAAEMESLKAQTRELNRAIPGYWSVDWLDTDRGWYMIDMALGEMSYMWSPGEDFENG